MPFDGTKFDELTRTLIGARQYLIERGWCHGGARVGRTVCMAMAISDVLRAEGRHREYDRVASVLARTVGVSPKKETLNANAVALGNWNDAAGRTIGEVLDAFDRAIASPPNVD